MNKSREYITPLVFLIVLFILAGAIASIPQKTPFTELYFPNHLKLQKNIFLNKTYNFQVAVKNNENQKMAYFLTAYKIFNQTSKTIDSKVVFLNQNQEKNFTFSYSFEKPFEQAKILVRLHKITHPKTPWIGKHYQKELQIYFWVSQITPVKVIHID